MAQHHNSRHKDLSTFVARYKQLIGLHMMWNFSTSSHRKGEHNGVGAVIKRTLTHEELKPNMASLKCVADVVNFLKATFGDKGQSHMCNTQIFFWLVSQDEVQQDVQWECLSIKGSCIIHCVDGYAADDPCTLRLRTLSCFCDPCVSGQWRRCKSKQHIKE